MTCKLTPAAIILRIPSIRGRQSYADFLSTFMFMRHNMWLCILKSCSWDISLTGRINIRTNPRWHKCVFTQFCLISIRLWIETAWMHHVRLTPLNDLNRWLQTVKTVVKLVNNVSWRVLTFVLPQYYSHRKIVVK